MSANGLPGWYLPTEGHLWDPWFFKSGEVIHLFHLLQRLADGVSREQVLPRDRPVIAHATWTERDGWVPRGVAVDYTDAPFDSERIHTGCVVRDGDAYAMLYSGSNRFICLARSPDLDHWTKVVGNPVIQPDPRRYQERWRDPWIVDGPTGAPHTVVIAAQQPHPGDSPIGIVAVAHSTDLMQWEQDEPLQTPAWFTWLEVPEIHEVDGTWYLVPAVRDQNTLDHRTRRPGVPVGRDCATRRCLLSDGAVLARPLQLADRGPRYVYRDVRIRIHHTTLRGGTRATVALVPC